MNLDDDSAMIDAVENILFKKHFMKTVDREKAARAVFATCPDDNLRFLLGNAVGYCAKDPAYSRRFIYRARDHIVALRESLR